MPTSSKVKKALFSHLPRDFQGNIYELGAGWGTLALPLAQFYSDSSVIAYEISPFPFTVCSLRKFLKRQYNLKVHRRDFLRMDLSEADLVICYLYPGGMTRLEEKFAKELKPGTLVISNTFSLPSWKPKKRVEAHDLYQSSLYFYEV